MITVKIVWKGRYYEPMEQMKEMIILKIFFYFILILLFLLVDYYWLDIDTKRWGWFKNRSKKQKTIFFTV